MKPKAEMIKMIVSGASLLRPAMSMAYPVVSHTSYYSKLVSNELYLRIIAKPVSLSRYNIER
jgi:hypothetical protein